MLIKKGSEDQYIFVVLRSGERMLLYIEPLRVPLHEIDSFLR